MDITKPTYSSGDGFCVNFYKMVSEGYLTLSEAIAKFVKLSGTNIIKAYCFFYNTCVFYSDAMFNRITVDNSIACNKLVTNEIFANTIKVKNITFDYKLKATIYYNNMSIPCFEDFTNNYGIQINLKNSKILLNSNTKAILYYNDTIMRIFKPKTNPYFYDINFDCDFISFL